MSSLEQRGNNDLPGKVEKMHLPELVLILPDYASGYLLGGITITSINDLKLSICLLFLSCRLDIVFSCLSSGTCFCVFRGKI